MKLIFTDGHWQTVAVSNDLNRDGELDITFDLAIDDKVDFTLTIGQVEELCHGLLDYVKKFKD